MLNTLKSILIVAIAGITWWEHLMRRNRNDRIFRVSYSVAVVRFTDQNWIPKIVYCIRCVMVCKIGFSNWNAKITAADRHSGILMSLLVLVAETIIIFFSFGMQATFSKIMGTLVEADLRLLQHPRWIMLEAVNYYHKALHLGCCCSPRSVSD